MRPSVNAPVMSRIAPNADQDRRIADYQLLGELGRGGMAVVHLARRGPEGPLVALKVLEGGSATDVARFHHEARAAAEIRHECVAGVRDIGSAGAVHWYAMDYVEGESLARRIERGPVPAPLAAKIVRDASRGVAAAHGLGMIHRDLKPANVLLRLDGRAIVVDFGLAQRSGADPVATQAGAVVGTPHFMAPEQAFSRAERIGPWSDVWSLGATLYAALTGRPPFGERIGFRQIAAGLALREPLPPSRLVPDLPRELEQVVLTAIDRDPGRRYPDARRLADDLDRFLRGAPPEGFPAGLPRRFLRWISRLGRRFANVPGSSTKEG